MFKAALPPDTRAVGHGDRRAPQGVSSAPAKPLSGPYAAMAGVAGQRSSAAPPVALPPTVTERSAAAASSRSAGGLSERQRPASQPAEKRIVQQRHSDQVDWGTEYNLVKEPLHLGHIASPHPDSAIRKVGKHMPAGGMKDLWNMRNRGNYPLRTVTGETTFGHTDTAWSPLSAATADVRFGHLGNSWSSLGCSQTLGSTGGFGRSKTMRSPSAAKGAPNFKDKLTATSSSYGWQPGGENAEWSRPGTFTNGQPWKHGIYQSAVTKYYHNQKITGSDNAMRLIL